MKTVAVLGGGPGGSFAAERLARAGLRTILFDEKMAWEKPCGGGLTYKAYQQYPYLLNNDVPKRIVHQTTLAAPKAAKGTLQLRDPLVIYARRDLNQMLLDRASHAGAQLEQTRVLAIERQNAGWRIRTKHGAAEADYCVVATGARNPLKDVGTAWTPSDTTQALGYFIPSEQHHIDIEFIPRIGGYIWIFPRCGHLSAGIGGKGVPSAEMRALLERYLDRQGIAWRGSPFYGHMLPALERDSWSGNRVAGDGWLAVGDAAGLVDPITGEGIYYAMRSGELAAETILADEAPETRAADYRSKIQRDFMADLEYAAHLARRVFVDRRFLGSPPARMIQLMQRSPSFREIVQDLFAGTQPYLGLKRRLLDNWSGTLRDLLLHFFFYQLVPARASALRTRT